jgi:hypothetical protein
MQTNDKFEALLNQIEFLYERYSLEPRATTQPYVLATANKQIKNYEYKPEDLLVRERLIEHVGSLPIIAITFFPYIDDPQVSLGDAMTMLAIHDIGELVVGDEITFTKISAGKGSEEKAALSLLHPSYHDLYKDVESKSSQTAKFAKAIDKITPDIVDYLTPADITIMRMKHFTGVDVDGIVPLIEKHKRPYMLWNRFMTEFHVYLLDMLAAKISSPLTKTET